MKKLFSSVFFVLSCLFFPLDVQAENHPVRPIPKEKIILVSNQAMYPVVSVEVSGKRGFQMTSGGDQVLFRKISEVLELKFVIDTVRWGCLYSVTGFFSDGETSIVDVNICTEGKAGVNITFTEGDETR